MCSRKRCNKTHRMLNVRLVFGLMLCFDANFPVSMPSSVHFLFVSMEVRFFFCAISSKLYGCWRNQVIKNNLLVFYCSQINKNSGSSSVCMTEFECYKCSCMCACVYLSIIVDITQNVKCISVSQ